MTTKDDPPATTTAGAMLQPRGLALGLLSPLALGLIWAGLAAAVDPRGDFSVNDDWAYGLPVRALVERGEIRFTFWQSMTLIAQVFWGAIFCLPGGFSFEAVRLSTLLAGLAGILGLHGLLRQVGAGRAMAFLGSLIYAVGPIYLGMSCTFMTDIPYDALMILSILALARGLDADDGRMIWLGLSAALVALFVRQLALAVFLGFLVASPVRYGFGRRWLVRAVLPLAVAGGSLAAFTKLARATGRLPAIFDEKPESLKAVVRDLLHLHVGALKPALAASFLMMMFTGLMAAPWLALVGPSLVARGSTLARRLRAGWIVAFTLATTAALAASGDLMPMTGNTMAEFKMGPLTLAGVPPAGPPAAFWVAVTAVASAGFAALLLVVFDLADAIVRGGRDPEATRRRCLALLLIATGVTYFGPIGLPYQLMLDRYMLPVLALFMALSLLVPGVATRRPPAPAWVASILMAAGFAGYAVATTHDYFAWRRVVWAAATDLADSQKVPTEEIDGGFEFNNQLPNWREISTTSVRAGLVEHAEARRYSVSFGEMPGFEVIGRRPVPAWLPYSPREILVLRRPDPARAPAP